MENFTTITLLTQKQRLKARKAAIEAIAELAGREPKREDYRNTIYGKYPEWLVRTVIALCGVMLLAAFFPSASRLYQIGSTTFAHGIQDNRTAILVGVCIVMLSETGALLFTLTLAVVANGLFMRIVLVFSIIACVIIALVGNYQVAIYLKENVTLFTYLEALLPPMLTLSTSYILKEIALHAIEQRHLENVAYQEAHRHWRIATESAEQHPNFLQAYANEIRDGIKRLNGKVAQKAALEKFTGKEWSALVNQVMKEDSWFPALVQEVEAPVVASPLSELVALPSGNGAHP